MNIHKTPYILVILFFLVLSTSCASTSVSQKEISEANYGQVPTNYEYDIKNLMSNQLKDPGSAIYEFGVPRKGYTKDGWATGGKTHFGYVVPVNVNAKNSYGGYTGKKPYYYLFSEGLIYDVTNLFSMGMGKYVN